MILYEFERIIALYIFIVNYFREISAKCTIHLKNRRIGLAVFRLKFNIYAYFNAYFRSVVPLLTKHPHGAFFPEKNGDDRHQNKRQHDARPEGREHVRKIVGNKIGFSD